jgi:site-specific recombinase XerD
MEIEGFLSHWEHSKGCSPQTLKAYRSDLKDFEAFLKSRSLRITQVRPSTINEYIAKMTV